MTSEMRLTTPARRAGPPAPPLAAAALALAALGLPLPAVAGSGPWVVSPQQWSLYAGVESQRITELALADGLGDPSVIEVDDGIETTSVTGIVSYGLRKRVELELTVPWKRVEANRPGGAACASLGPETCATTDGFAIFAGRGKVLVLDELKGSPVSLAAGGELRLGQHTSPTRDRVTNLGEGTNDVGAFVAVGRGGGLGEGSWSAHLDALGRYRDSNRAADADPVPGAELAAEAEVFAGTRPWWSLGAYVSYWERPAGVDFGEGDLADIDRFGALNANSVRVGGKVLLRAADRSTLVLSGGQTLAARNNPRVRSAGVGLVVYPERRRPGQGG
jgi:hypothetical protein